MAVWDRRHRGTSLQQALLCVLAASASVCAVEFATVHSFSQAFYPHAAAERGSAAVARAQALRESAGSVLVVLGDATFTVTISDDYVASLRLHRHVGVTAVEQRSRVSAVMSAIGAVDLSTRRALEELLPSVDVEPLAHLELIMETGAGRDGDPSGRSFLRQLYLDLRPSDDVAATAHRCCEELAAPMAECTAFVRSEIHAVLGVPIEKRGVRASPATSFSPKVWYAHAWLPRCLLLREGFDGERAAALPRLGVSRGALGLPVADSHSSAFDAWFRVQARVASLTATLPLRVSVLYGIISFDMGATGKALYVLQMLQRALDMARSGRYSVHVHLFITSADDIAVFSAEGFESLVPDDNGGGSDQQLDLVLDPRSRECVSDTGPLHSYCHWFRVTVQVLPRTLERAFAWRARSTLLQHASAFDVTAFFEDDHLLSTTHVDAFLSWTACEHLSTPSAVPLAHWRDDGSVRVAPDDTPWHTHRSCDDRLPPQWIAGFLQYEVASDGEAHLLNAALMHNDGYRLYEHGRSGARFLVMQNIHQAGFVATRKQLQHALARECLPDRYSYHWSYHEIEAADSQLYFDCGFMKVVPLEPTFTAAGISDGGVSLQAFLLHHAPNKYVQEGVHVVDKFYLTAALLERWLSMCDRDM